MERSEANTERRAYNVPRVAGLLGISTNRCYDLIAEGAIPSIRLGHRIIVPVPAFEAWLASAGRPQAEAGEA
jgi:excisionase family DNA binding protein